MNVTIKDIARLAGVSYSTVSKALMDSPLVKPDTKRRIVDLADELGYQPNIAAKSLVSRRSMTIGIILPTLERIALSALVGRINDALAVQGYEVVLSILPPASAVKLFQRLQIDGIVVFENISPEDQMIDWVTTNIPVLTIGSSHISSSRYAMVDVKRKDAIKIAVHYLYELGHRRMVFIGDDRDSDSKQREKVAGFKEAAYECGLTAEQAAIINSMENTWYHGYEAGRRMLALEKLPTAVVAGSFDLTAGLLRAIQDGGLHVPEDISIVSYDHVPQLAELDVPITAVGSPVDAYAQRIAETLLGLIGASEPIRLTSLLEAVIEERSSCRKLN